MTVDFELLKQNLSGSWSFEREITGLSPLSGSAEFRPIENDLFYREELKMPALHGEPLNAYREYFYVFSTEGLTLFHAQAGARGELFMRLTHDPTASVDDLQAFGSHLCGQDRYEGSFHFRGPLRFSIKYEVHGPMKDYQIGTEYQRL